MQISKYKGFTLVEVLLVIILLAVLMGIVVLAINPRNIISEVNDNKREADALTIYQALEQYAVKNNTYPDSIKNMTNNSSAYICKTSATSCNTSTQINLSSLLVPTYFSKIPEYSTDTNNSGFYIVKDSNGKIGVGGVKQVNNTTFVKGLESQSFATVPVPQIVKTGLVLRLDAGDIASYIGSGTTWTDLSGNNNNGTLVNGVGYSSANGGSLVFDGLNDYISINNSSTLNLSSGLTISIWFYSGTVSANNYLYLKGRTDFDNYNPLISTVGGYEWTGVNGRARYIPSAGFINNNTWYNLVVSHNSGNIPNIYLNSVLSTSHTFIEGVSNFALGTNTNPVGINADIPRGYIGNFNGQISSIFVYNRSLTAEEVQQNFNATKARFGF